MFSSMRYTTNRSSKCCQQGSRNTKLIKWFPTSHTDVEQAGKIAHEAEVKTLVLSHIVPGDNPKVTDEMWLEGASKHFKGTNNYGKDLLTI